MQQRYLGVIKANNVTEKSAKPREVVQVPKVSAEDRFENFSKQEESLYKRLDVERKKRAAARSKSLLAEFLEISSFFAP